MSNLVLIHNVNQINNELYNLAIGIESIGQVINNSLINGDTKTLDMSGLITAVISLAEQLEERHEELTETLQGVSND